MMKQPTGADAFAPFQQALTEGWSKALESFQQSAAQGASAFSPGGTPLWQMPQMPQMPSMPGLANGMKMPELPKFSIAPEKLQAIQQQYLADATELWGQGFNARPEGDKRFAGEAWGTQPVRGLLGGDLSAQCAHLAGPGRVRSRRTRRPRSRLRFAIEQMDGRIGAEQLRWRSMSQAQRTRGRDARVRASPRA
jgi:polyhydroxyalkanoate synthase